MWSRLLHLFGIHTMRVDLDDGDTLRSRCRWCCETTYDVSPSYREG
jgi:hypothetical protein